ncbi:hypothetical protein SAMN05720761_1511 [Fibrobacter sp. UWCM]|jgi:hypothetical protein|uniref:hypothetical protein n=1 Tax=Fibrobacter sp. UWCM TaxID=1896208 RepID=UPI00091FC9EB|nr:hypothetical protein [Fibrobacter sp. UWCM]SHH93382.1 hypothetical protein SAMN05720761_1511 [Fibrobacter sp. UWCM]
MSRTEKAHAHKCPGIRYAAASHRAKTKAARSASKSEIKKMSDPEALEFSFEQKRRNRPNRSGSRGYLNPLISETEFLKGMRSARQSITNDVQPWPEYIVIDKSLHKDIRNRVKQKDPNFEGDVYQALLHLSDEELAECIHCFYASKGLKGTKR